MRQKRKREQFLMQIYFFVYSLKWHKKGKHEQNNRKITEKLYRFKHECSWIKKNETESNLYNILHCTWLRKIKMNEQNIKLQKLFIISVKLTRIVALNHIFLFSSPISPYHSCFFFHYVISVIEFDRWDCSRAIKKKEKFRCFLVQKFGISLAAAFAASIKRNYERNFSLWKVAFHS